MALVLDVSGILSMAFDDEDSTYSQALLDSAAADRLLVPTLFWFELRNALVMGERRGRIDATRTNHFLSALSGLTWEVDTQPDEPMILNLARRYGLTVYDASYLDLARRRNLPLATRDHALITAAPLAGIDIWQM